VAFQVVFTRRANADIATTEQWLTQFGSASVKRWRVRLLRIIEKLEADPHRYPQASEAETIGIDLREALIGRRPPLHRVLFSIDGQIVTIQRLRYAAQDQLNLDDI
jgi:plasmid stabilization system protein ParE